MSRANLWWAYDPEDASFSALPASPLLIPAMLIFGLVAIGKQVFSPTRLITEGHGAIGKTPKYQRHCKRWRELMETKLSIDEDKILTPNEWTEYYTLQRWLTNPTTEPDPDLPSLD